MRRGGKRIGAGRPAKPEPRFLKVLRATEQEREELKHYLTGDARQDFLRIMNGLRRAIKPKGE